MTPTPLPYWRIAIALALPVAYAQKCYYPNGAEAPEKPCSSAQGSACCPDNWECLDNGLCHYPPNNLWGRYSCTDSTWQAEACPSNLCTYNMVNAVGGESITQCADHDNQWCCNADAQHVNCCKESPAPRPFFALPDGKAYATIGGSTAASAPNLATITGKADAADAGPSATTTASNAPPSTDAPSTTPPPNTAEPSTTLQTALSSGTAGIVTIIRTSLITPTATSAPIPPSTSSSKLPIIIGCALGIPLALALLGILLWLLRKRSQQRKRQQPDSSKPPFADEILTEDGSPNPPHSFVGGAEHAEKPTQTPYTAAPSVPELGGNAIGPERPISTLAGRAELDSGNAFRPGAQAPHAPQFVGLGGGTGHVSQGSWGGSTDDGLPGVPAGYSEADSRPVSMANTGPGSGPRPGGYVAYRPDNLVPAPRAELSAVVTPPAGESSGVRAKDA